MDSPHSSVGMFFYLFDIKIVFNSLNILKIENENILSQALRTYEESERSLKSVCNSVEQENNQLEEQLKTLQTHQTTLIKQYHLIKERLHQIRGEHARLAERQLFIDQQTNQIHQRFVYFL
jgi:chromosome segregation ATPase